MGWRFLGRPKARIMTRSPIKRKPRRPKSGDDPKYLKWIREQPCVVPGCAGGWWRHVEAAHFGQRSIALKPPDAEALPLCASHHRIGPKAHHVLGSDRLFEQAHGINLGELIAEHRARYALIKEE